MVAPYFSWSFEPDYNLSVDQTIIHTEIQIVHKKIKINLLSYKYKKDLSSLVFLHKIILYKLWKHMIKYSAFQQAFRFSYLILNSHENTTFNITTDSVKPLLHFALFSHCLGQMRFHYTIHCTRLKIAKIYVCYFSEHCSLLQTN